MKLKAPSHRNESRHHASVHRSNVCCVRGASSSAPNSLREVACSVENPDTEPRVELSCLPPAGRTIALDGTTGEAEPTKTVRVTDREPQGVAAQACTTMRPEAFRWARSPRVSLDSNHGRTTTTTGEPPSTTVEDPRRRSFPISPRSPRAPRGDADHYQPVDPPTARAGGIRDATACAGSIAASVDGSRAIRI